LKALYALSTTNLRSVVQFPIALDHHPRRFGWSSSAAPLSAGAGAGFEAETVSSMVAFADALARGLRSGCLASATTGAEEMASGFGEGSGLAATVFSGTGFASDFVSVFWGVSGFSSAFGPLAELEPEDVDLLDEVRVLVRLLVEVDFSDFVSAEAETFSASFFCLSSVAG
jgi:hypothetical protein